MNILFDINHPAHVHLFRHSIQILKNQGHKVLITAREKDITISLLKHYKLNYTLLSKARKSLWGLGLELLQRQCQLCPLLLKHHIQVCVSVTGACNVHIARILGIPCLVFYDTEHAKLQNKLTIPFATKFITPQAYQKHEGINHVTYKGFHDLAYLHPDYFTPDPRVLDLLKIKTGQKYVILRFVGWGAAHDIGHQGLSHQMKKNIIELFLKKGIKVFIVSETDLSDEFKDFLFPIPPEKMHDALYYATMYIGEGGSMASESAILGTPAIFVSTLTAGVFEELEKKV